MICPPVKTVWRAVTVLAASGSDGWCAQKARFDLRCAKFVADMASRNNSVIVDDTAVVEAMFQQSGQLLDKYSEIDLRLDHVNPSLSGRQAMVGRACADHARRSRMASRPGAGCSKRIEGHVGLMKN